MLEPAPGIQGLEGQRFLVKVGNKSKWGVGDFYSEWRSSCIPVETAHLITPVSREGWFCNVETQISTLVILLVRKL